jgi:transcription antitermination factor NusG
LEDLTAMQEVINGVPAPTLTPVPKAWRPSVGELVSITVGPFAGFGGMVEDVDGDGVATVSLKNSIGVLKIPSCVLRAL